MNKYKLKNAGNTLQFVLRTTGGILHFSDIKSVVIDRIFFK